MSEITIQLDDAQTLRVGRDRHEPDRWVLETVRGNATTVSEVSSVGASRLLEILRVGAAALERST